MHEGLEKWLLLMDSGEGIKTLMALLSLSSTRMLAVMLVLPCTSSQRMPGMTRAGLPLWLGLYIAWGQPVDALSPLSTLSLGVLFLKEAFIGFLIGFAASSIFWVAEGVGSMIDNLAGYNNVQQSNPQSSDQSTPVGNMMSELSIFSFYFLGGMLSLVGVLFDSYTWWPLAQVVPSGTDLLARFAQAQLASYMAAVAQIAGPVLLVLTLIDLSFGLLSKTAEKLEPNGMAQPVKGAATMVLLSLLLAVFFHQFRADFALVNFGKTLQRALAIPG